MVGEDLEILGIRRLELSAAARYTGYSDFGSNTSPRYGILWEAVEGLNLRATYSEGFRAPTLSELDPNNGSASIIPLMPIGLPDFWSDDGTSVPLLLFGSAGRDLKPESSESVTFGIDFRPSFLDGLDVSMTYFSIDYNDRIGWPDPGNTFLFVPGDFEDIINENPTRAEIEDAVAGYAEVFDQFGLVTDPNDLDQLSGVVSLIMDNRVDNLAISKTSGIDLSFEYGKELSFGNINAGTRITYTIDSVQKVKEASPEFTILDSVGNPTALKFRTFAGFNRGGFSSQMNINYVDSYENNLVIPSTKIDSWATVDLNIQYAFDNENSLFEGAVVSLNINNLTDQDPPFVGRSERSGPGGFGLQRSTGYDPVNANPVGRFVTIGLRKQF